MDFLSLFGLGLITISWAIQLYKIIAKKEKTFDFKFLVMYAVGAFALAYVGFRAADFVSAGLNVLTGIGALIVGYYIKE